MRNKPNNDFDWRLTIALLFSVCIYYLHVFTENSSQMSPVTESNVAFSLRGTEHLVLTFESVTKSMNDEDKLPLRYFPVFFRSLPINDADKEMLMTVKGVGPVMAEAIIAYRNQTGPITRIEDFHNIPGIGQKRAAAWNSEFTFDTKK